MRMHTNPDPRYSVISSLGPGRTVVDWISDKLEYLFGSQAGETGSAALIPLTAPPLAGVLAIGSRDPERFHHGKSVDFLQRLAEVVSAKLQSASSPGN